MAKDSSVFVCQQCGMTQPKWSGKCGGCESWNSFVEEGVTSSPFTKTSKYRNRSSSIKFENLEDQSPEVPRFFSGIAEFDRVCGGGLSRALFFWWEGILELGSQRFYCK
jgi:DNA repair protein RadA/Sms